MPTTIWIIKVSSVTEIIISQTNIPAIVPADICYLGWQDSIHKLTILVEHDIKDQ